MSPKGRDGLAASAFFLACVSLDTGVYAQTREANRARCTASDADQAIAGCTALISSGLPLRSTIVAVRGPSLAAWKTRLRVAMKRCACAPASPKPWIHAALLI